MKKLLTTFAIAAATVTAHAQWSYKDQQDEMTGKTTHQALAQSSNILDLPFPYQGYNWGYLMVRTSNRGPQVIYSVDKGQILCPSHSGCTVKVRFDEAQPVSFSGRPANDGSSEFVFLMDTKRFIKLATGAKTIRVQVNMYQAGAPVMTFQLPKTLSWPPK